MKRLLRSKTSTLYGRLTGSRVFSRASFLCSRFPNKLGSQAGEDEVEAELELRVAVDFFQVKLQLGDVGKFFGG